MAGRLRAKQIAALPPGRHGDGGTLFIVVEPGGRSRHWVQRLTVDGRRRDLGLGGYPYVGLAEARAAAFANRQLARRGGDPTASVRQSRIPTFRTACERVAETATWKGDGAKNRRNALERYCGSLMPRRIDQIRRPDVIAILVPVLAEKPATGSKLHGWIRGALAWAVAGEYVEFNVADGIGAALPSGRNAQKHHAALPYQEVGAAMHTIAASGASDVVKACLRFTILTAVRSGEARGARWSEMDLEAAEWRISAERMKAGREHRVPLSRAATDTLERVRSLHSPAGLCFPSPIRASKQLCPSTLKTAMKQLYGDRCTVHGFRSSFRDWASEQTSVPHAVAEAALAHQVGSAVERSYARSDLFDKRRGLMDRWAEYVTK
ncbi:MAG: tyrosine-type recombinase/integrase [Acidobacteria bacterium]|nr:tyrosine-type recombinase/integrase [Acidobacteriota bacterium]